MGKRNILITFLSLAIHQFNLNASVDLGSRETTRRINDSLISAIQNKSLTEMQLSLRAGADVNATAHNGMTGLMYASRRSGSQELVKLLLDKGAAINAIDNHGKTALMRAVDSGSKDIAELLLNNGAAVDVVDIHGNTELMHAVRSGSKDMVKLLLKAGVDVDAVGNNSWTALMYAVRSRYKEIIRLLLQAGANVNRDGSTGIILEDFDKIKQILMRSKVFKFVKINQKFGKEPEPEDYFKNTETVVGKNDGLENTLDQYKELTEAFENDHFTYWHDKVQIAYVPFAFQNDSKPLRTFLIQEISKRNGLILVIVRFFNSRKEFLSVLNNLKSGATEEELELLEYIIVLEEYIEQKKINLEKYYDQENIAARNSIK